MNTYSHNIKKNGDVHTDNVLTYETRVESPPDFQLKRVSALKELEIPMISSSVKALTQ